MNTFADNLGRCIGATARLAYEALLPLRWLLAGREGSFRFRLGVFLLYFLMLSPFLFLLPDGGR